MRTAAFLPGVALFLACCGTGAAGAQDSSALPPGAGKEIVQHNCADCHALDVITSKRQSAAEWHTTVERMANYGISLSQGDIDMLTDYLSTNFGLTPAK